MPIVDECVFKIHMRKRKKNLYSFVGCQVNDTNRFRLNTWLCYFHLDKKCCINRHLIYEILSRFADFARAKYKKWKLFLFNLLTNEKWMWTHNIHTRKHYLLVTLARKKCRKKRKLQVDISQIQLKKFTCTALHGYATVAVRYVKRTEQKK